MISKLTPTWMMVYCPECRALQGEKCREVIGWRFIRHLSRPHFFRKKAGIQYAQEMLRHSEPRITLDAP